MNSNNHFIKEKNLAGIGQFPNICLLLAHGSNRNFSDTELQ
jgi:hypothetical protein